MPSEKLPPLKAKEPGQGGRKHTLAHFDFNESGQYGIRLECHKLGCNCGGFYSFEELKEMAAGADDLKQERKDAA
jgi:hypothetical protein